MTEAQRKKKATADARARRAANTSKKTSNGWSPLEAIFVVLVAVILFVGGLLTYDNFRPKQTLTVQTTAGPATLAPTPAVAPAAQPAQPAPAPVQTADRTALGPYIKLGGRLPNETTMKAAGEQRWKIKEGYPGDGTCPKGAKRCPNTWVQVN